MDKLYQEAIEIITAVKSHVTPDTDVDETRYESVEELILALDNYIQALNKTDDTVIVDIYILFLPTASFCELAMSNGWADEYLILAEQFDVIYKKHNSPVNRFLRTITSVLRK